MDELRVNFVGSYPSLSKSPPPKLPEVAFVGRSNVGKSSLLNMLTGKRGLARTSSTPGRTQLINHFEVEEGWMLVDLPGYGYAKLSKKHRASLDTMVRTYVAGRASLYVTFVLLDAQLPLQANDAAMIHWLAERQLPQAWIFTKVDKGRKQQARSQVSATLKTLHQSWEDLPPHFVTSSMSGEGRAAVLDFIRTSLLPAPQP